MKFIRIIQAFIFLTILASCYVTASPIEMRKESVYQLPSTPTIKSQTKPQINVELLSCKNSDTTYIESKTNQQSELFLGDTHTDSLNYLSDIVKVIACLHQSTH